MYGLTVISDKVPEFVEPPLDESKLQTALPSLNFRDTNEETMSQLYAVIMLSCVEQTNAEDHKDGESWERAFTARFKNRTSDQKELPV